ncbi:hypothetical protein H2201_005674 [Coniosporium apollinis]|uniref:Major facilitator superfamily (MFS) profile domain-containing protein n=1 Tax=Coniosporium apollinis TaxID=61459 RepID=A0ABQ9NSR3_9PEZI|nr:hypothetical protein H2201_005674 [Coniosporium apollinis]
MSVPATFSDPAFESRNLSKEDFRLAYEEGHDADLRSTSGPDVTHEKRSFNADLEKGDHPSTATSEAPTVVEDETSEPKDPNIVWWDEPADQDPANPMNWSSGKKWGNIAVLSAITFVTPLASSMFAPGVPAVMQDFRTDNTMLATFVVSVYILGFALGPLVVAPMSEMYGRLPLYLITNVLFVVFTIACAVSNSMSMLIGFRFLAGCVGSAPMTIGAGTIADIMPATQRARAMAFWAMGPLLGPVVGPVAGGFLVDAKGWRWVFWLIAIIAGATTAASFVLLRETYAPVLLDRKAARLRKETGNPDLKSKLHSGLPPKELFARSIVRPTKMLFLSPIVSLLSVYMSIAYGILYLLFTTFTFVFEQQYRFSSGEVGLTYIASGIGMILGLAVVGSISDRIIKQHTAKGEQHKPELRIPIFLTVPAGLSLALGLFLYGWTAEKQVQWAVPLLGTLFVGLGLMAIFMCIQTYLVDAFTVHAASAMAANTVLRSLFGALLPLCGLDMYEVLGLGWGNSLLGFVALAMVPIPALFRMYGERIRTSPRFQVKF